jgi:hypothetical protein
MKSGWASDPVHSSSFKRSRAMSWLGILLTEAGLTHQWLLILRNWLGSSDSIFSNFLSGHFLLFPSTAYRCVHYVVSRPLTSAFHALCIHVCDINCGYRKEIDVWS